MGATIGFGKPAHRTIGTTNRGVTPVYALRGMRRTGCYGAVGKAPPAISGMSSSENHGVSLLRGEGKKEEGGGDRTYELEIKKKDGFDITLRHGRKHRGRVPLKNTMHNYRNGRKVEKIYTGVESEKT